MRGLLQFSLLCGLLACSFCGQGFDGYKPFQIPGAGLSEQPSENIQWSLNVGIMTDAGFHSIQRSQIEKYLTSKSQTLSRLLPGLELHPILDQPMDAVFLLEQNVSGKALGNRLLPEAGILLVDDPAHNHQVWEQTDLPAGLQNRLQAGLQAYQQALKSVQINANADRITGSLYIWQSYFQKQVRNDLIVTNTPLLEDRVSLYAKQYDASNQTKQENLSLTARPVVKQAPDHSNQSAILHAPGRTAMERRGAIVSLYSMGKAPSPTAKPANTRTESATITQHAWSGLDTTLLSLIMADPSCLECQQLESCACIRKWPRRKQYLLGLARVRSDKLKQACQLMQEHRAYRWPGPEARWQKRLCH